MPTSRLKVLGPALGLYCSRSTWCPSCTSCGVPMFRHGMLTILIMIMMMIMTMRMIIIMIMIMMIMLMIVITSDPNNANNNHNNHKSNNNQRVNHQCSRSSLKAWSVKACGFSVLWKKREKESAVRLSNINNKEASPLRWTRPSADQGAAMCQQPRLRRYHPARHYLLKGFGVPRSGLIIGRGGSATACNCVRANCVLELAATACRFAVLSSISLMLVCPCFMVGVSSINNKMAPRCTACNPSCVQLRAAACNVYAACNCVGAGTA